MGEKFQRIGPYIRRTPKKRSTKKEKSLIEQAAQKDFENIKKHFSK